MGKSDTKRLKQIMTSAGEEAKRLGNSKIYPEHLFLGLLRLSRGRAIDVLMALGVDFYEVKDRIEEKLAKKKEKKKKLVFKPFDRVGFYIGRQQYFETGDGGSFEIRR